MRKDKITLICSMVFFLSGCSLSHWDGKKSPRELEQEDNPFTWNEIYKVETTLWPLERKVVEMENKVNAMRKELAVIRELPLPSNQKIEPLQTDIKRINNESGRMEKPSADLIGAAPEIKKQVIVPVPALAESKKASPNIQSIMITNIQFQKVDTQDKVLVHLTATNNPKIQRLVNPPRIVLDFLNTRNTGKDVFEINADGTFIKRIRVRSYQEPVEKVRLVLDMIPNMKYVIDKKSSPKENTYSIAIKDSRN
jgi:hypothetical protein